MLKKERDNANCTIVVNSSEDNNDIWPFFLESLGDMWSDCPFDVCVVTENRLICNGVVNKDWITFPLLKKFWSYRLFSVLQIIQDEYIIFFLDDYYVKKPIKNSAIFGLMSMLDAWPSCSAIYMKHPHSPEDVYGYGVTTDCRKYHINAQVALWRRVDLIRLLNVLESPWQFERYSFIRSCIRKSKIMYLGGKAVPPIEYDASGVVARGAWVRKHIDFFIERYGWKIDLDTGSRRVISRIVNNDKKLNSSGFFIEKIRSIFRFFWYSPIAIIGSVITAILIKRGQRAQKKNL